MNNEHLATLREMRDTRAKSIADLEGNLERNKDDIFGVLIAKTKEHILMLKGERDALTFAIQTLEMVEAAYQIRFSTDWERNYFNSVNCYRGNPNQPYFGKWQASGGDYEHDTATEAYTALKEQGK
jgi:hypothetical protein